jgi:hypothetical protein
MEPSRKPFTSNHTGHDLALGALIIGLAGCTHVAPVRNPSSYVASEAPNRVWVKRSHDRVQMEAPRVSGDTLFGFVDGRFQELALTGSEQVEARVPARGRTWGLAFALTGVTAAVVANLFSHQSAKNGTGANTDCSGDADEPSGITC